MPDEIDEITDRSGKPHAGIEVEGEVDPPRVVVRLWLPGKEGQINAITMRYTTAEAKELADTIMGTADGLEYDVWRQPDAGRDT